MAAMSSLRKPTAEEAGVAGCQAGNAGQRRIAGPSLRRRRSIEAPRGFDGDDLRRLIAVFAES